MQPNFTILCATYNQAPYLPDMLDSVLAQTRQDYELIVVDDGSTDETPAVLAAWIGARSGAERARLKTIRTTNQGQSGAYEVGFAHSSGRWICLLDSDDMFMAHKLETVWNIAEYTDAGLIQHPLQVVDQDGVSTGEVRPKSAALSSGDRRSDMRVNARHVAPGASGLIIRRDVFSSLLPMPTKSFKFAADAYLSFGAVSLCPVAVTTHALSKYRMQPGGQYMRRIVTPDGLAQQVAFQHLLCDHFGLSAAYYRNSFFLRNEYALLRYTRSPRRWGVGLNLICATALDPYFDRRSKTLLLLFWAVCSFLPLSGFISMWEWFQKRQTGWSRVNRQLRRRRTAPGAVRGSRPRAAG